MNNPDSHLPPLESPVFLVESPHPWWSVWQRPHHIVSRLARHFPVCYVTRVYGRDLRKQRDGFRRWRDARDPEHGNIHLRAVTQWHGERISPILKRNQRAMVRAFERAAAVLPPGRPRVLWLYDPHKGYLADMIPHDRLVYDIMDEYSEFPFAPPRIRDEEAALIRRADQVFAGTWALFDRKKTQARRIKCYLSKVDVAHFAKARAPETPLPPEAAAWRERYECVVGYFGMVDQRIDWDLVKAAARARPRWGFVFVGPCVGAPEPAQLPPNVELLGQRDYTRLPSYCKAWDFCWIPFVRNEWTDHINPTKMLEYFASGRPALSVRIPDVVKCYSAEAWLGDTANDFIAAMDAIRATPAQAQPRLDLAAQSARQNSWDQLVRDMMTDLNIAYPG